MLNEDFKTIRLRFKFILSLIIVIYRRDDKKTRKTGDFDFSDKKKRRPEASLTIKVDDFT